MQDNMIEKIGFGAWQIGGSNVVKGANMGWDDIDETEAVALVENAYSLGLRFYDTSCAYGKGKSELILGKALGGKEDVSFATKYGPIYEDGAMRMDFSKANMRKSLEQSLKRLGASSIDFFMLHSPKPEDINQEIIESLEELKAEGLIKNSGLSVSFIEPFIKHVDSFDSFELLFNTITRGNLEHLPLLENKQVFFRSIFASGLLLKSNHFFNEMTKLSDWRKNLPQGLLEKIQQIPAENRTYSEVLNSALKLPVNKIIIGMGHQNHLKSLSEYLMEPV